MTVRKNKKQKFLEVPKVMFLSCGVLGSDMGISMTFVICMKLGLRCFFTFLSHVSGKLLFEDK